MSSRIPRDVLVVVAVGGAYLAMPFDLIPDFIPVLGWADDLIVVLLLLWYASRRMGEDEARARFGFLFRLRDSLRRRKSA
jgi:uncharacterized membrane protein YkvA (DUF1232 family)